MSTLVAIVLVLIVLALLAALALAARKLAIRRTRHELGEPGDDVYPYRSHAEESRRSGPDRP